MGRTIIAEETIENQLHILFKKDKWSIGLIIGQVTDQRDYALHLATTPKSDLEENVSKKQQIKRPENLDSVDESWIATHARQVLRMLPGGLTVIGIFGMAPPEVMKEAQNKLRQVIFAVQKVTGKLSKESVSQERIVLQICPLSRKITCRTYNTADPKCSANPADWKYQRFAQNWHRLDTNTALDLLIPVPNEAMSQSLERQILRGLEPMSDNIWNSIATIDHQMAAGDGLLDPSQTQSKKSKKQQEENTGKTYNMHLYTLRPAIDAGNISDPVITPCGAKLALRGTMACRAFIHSKATKDEAVKAVKQDIVRTLISRCELLCEDLLQTEEEQDPKVLYETPLRVFAPLGETSVQLCDYMFQDETNNDVVDRFKELIDLTVPEDMLETDCERLPENADLDTPVRERSDPLAEKSRKSNSGLQTLVYVIGILVVLLAVVVGFLLQQHWR